MHNCLTGCVFFIYFFPEQNIAFNYRISGEVGSGRDGSYLEKEKDQQAEQNEGTQGRDDNSGKGAFF